MKMHNPPHPGLTLRDDVLPALGLTVTEAAQQLNVARATLSRVINGRAAVSPEMALRIEARNNRYIKSQTDKVPLKFNDGTTTLTEYLELDTWTPDQAACLVAGIKPETMTYLAKRPNDIAYKKLKAYRACDYAGGMPGVPKQI